MPSVIALFIDYENVHYGLVNQYRFKPDASRLTTLILDEVGKEGNILIKRAYADWEKPEFNGVQATLKRSGIEPAYTLSKKTSKAGVQTTWKESADAVLLLDALQTLFERQEIEQFVIVTGDRAALDLVHRLTGRGKKVRICALESALAQELQDSVKGEVISIEKLLGIEPLHPKQPLTVANLPVANLLDAAGQPDWQKVILKLADLEKRPGFVGCKVARLRDGFTQQILSDGQKRGVLEIYHVPNPDNPEHPTSAIRLNRANEEVCNVLNST
jgi:uncharacterized LabA/DUF88 family protein